MDYKYRNVWAFIEATKSSDIFKSWKPEGQLEKQPKRKIKKGIEKQTMSPPLFGGLLEEQLGVCGKFKHATESNVEYTAEYLKTPSSSRVAEIMSIGKMQVKEPEEDKDAKLSQGKKEEVTHRKRKLNTSSNCGLSIIYNKRTRRVQVLDNKEVRELKNKLKKKPSSSKKSKKKKVSKPSKSKRQEPIMDKEKTGTSLESNQNKIEQNSLQN